ncbi:MAG: hypothetical protein GX269_06760 [Clostridiales bacterium]|nr:hypothetical protein [Clostridiales bacterium]
MPTTAKKGITGNSNAIVESTTKSKTSETAKNSEKTTKNSPPKPQNQTPPPPAKPQPVAPPQPPPPSSNGMSWWVTEVSQNPYGYANAWGTIAQMENDCKAYAESIGLNYDKSLNLGNGHWITPTASYGFSSSQAFKKDIFSGIEFTKTRTDYTFTDINVVFVTMDNYKDGRCIGHEDNAEMYLKGNRDLIEVYFVIA